MLKTLKIDQIHIRALMLCMSKMGKEHTHIFAHNFLNIQSIFNPKKSFEKLRLRAFQPYHQILYILKHVKYVKDRSNIPKGCNTMYVEDVKDGKRTYTHIFAQHHL